MRPKGKSAIAQGVDGAYGGRRPQIHASQIEVWPVWRTDLDCKQTGSAASSVSAIANKIYPLTAEYVQVGDYLVVDTNGPAGELDRIVNQLLDGKPSGPPLAAAEAFPESGYLRSDMDIAGLINGIGELIPEGANRVQLPRLDPGLPPVALTAFEAGDTTQYRARIPKSVVTAVQQVFASIKPVTVKPPPRAP